ncbi:MAG: KPN_02809 family neutral zinc metallopeptidase [Burkholderiales bacterium]
MRWEGGRESGNVEDRRGMSVGRGVAGGGIGVIIIAVIAMFMGVDPNIILEGAKQLEAPQSQTPTGNYKGTTEEEKLKQFVSVVLADTEDTWRGLFQKAGRQYQDPRLVLFTGAVDSACGTANSAVGPFYCPGDQKVYIDLGFYRELRDRFKAPGEFAQAYVLAHEVGHHVQNLLGISEQVQRAQSRMGQAQANALSVRVELQADCFAGVWANNANRTRSMIENGDVEAALNAAAAIGDDRLQRQARGTVSPESFTHGTSEQRMRWFKRGLESGSVQACDTFKAAQL